MVENGTRTAAVNGMHSREMRMVGMALRIAEAGW